MFQHSRFLLVVVIATIATAAAAFHYMLATVSALWIRFNKYYVY